MPTRTFISSTELHTFELGNGLRVVADYTDEVARTAVALHYGVGFRSEPESKEGFAHLFEHLMFQGSQRVPKGMFYAQVKATAGYVNGTTHQDYTDYQHLIAPWDLERTLYFEADRMRAPQFTRGTLQEQLELVQQEIYFNTAVEPYAGFPWPKAPNLLFDDYPNAHDGYGDMNRLRSISLDECAEFFHDWYTPENAVLTITGRHSKDEVKHLADRFFGPIPARPARINPPLDQSELTASRTATFSDPNVTRPGVSISYRIPGPDRDPTPYLSLNALAKLLSMQSLGATALVDIDAQTGYFGAFDAVTPEVFNVVLTVGEQSSCDAAIETFDRALMSFQDPAVVEQHLKPALGTLRRQYILTGTDLLDRCRFIGKSQLLFGNPNLISSLPQSVAALTATDVAGAARALVRKHRAIVQILPRNGTVIQTASGDLQKTLDAITIPDGRDSQAHALGWAPTQGLPSYSKMKEPESTGLTESLSFKTSIVRGIPVAHCRENRSPLVELRLRFTTQGIGWEDPWGVRRVVDGIRGSILSRYPKIAETLDLEITADGEIIEFAGRAETGGLRLWFSTVGECISRDWPPLTPSPQSPAQSLSMLSDIIARKLLIDAAGWVGTNPKSQAAPAGPPTSHSIFSTAAASLVVIGNLDADVLEEALSAMRLPAGDGAKDQAMIRPQRSNLYHTVPIDGTTTVVSSYFIEPDATHISEAARYITAALYGGSSLSRLHRNPRLETVTARTGGIVSRRTLAGQPVSATRIVANNSTITSAAKEMKREEKSFKAYPPAQAEILQAIKYCENELRNVSDSPRTKADYFAGLMSRGVALNRYHHIGAELRQVTPALVSTTFAHLFSGERITVIVGDPTKLEG